MDVGRSIQVKNCTYKCMSRCMFEILKYKEKVLNYMKTNLFLISETNTI